MIRPETIHFPHFLPFGGYGRLLYATGIIFFFSFLLFLILLFESWDFFWVWFLSLLILPILLSRLFTRMLRLQWAKRMKETWVSAVKVNDRDMTVFQPNGARLRFPRKDHRLEILVFQERGKDLFCLEILYSCYTPRYFFLGKDKEKAAVLLACLGLPSFSARTPVPNAWKNWEAIPLDMNRERTTRKWGFGRGKQKRRAETDFPRINAEDSEMAGEQILPETEATLFSCFVEGKKGGWKGLVASAGFVSYGITGIVTNLFLGGVFYPGGLCVLLSSLFFLIFFFRQLQLSSNFFFRVTDQGLYILLHDDSIVFFNYGDLFFFKNLRTGTVERYISLDAMFLDGGEMAATIPFFRKMEKDLDELLHALTQASDRWMREKAVLKDAR